jgi:hypothetical protein
MTDRSPIRLITLGLAALLAAAPASAQVDLSGTWESKHHEDWIERWPGPDVADFLGLPINEDARVKALSYSSSALSIPERQCLYYQPTYTYVGPFGLRIWAEFNQATGETVAWRLNGVVDRALRTVWMDGRPHPSENAPHSFSGFSTGEWRGDTLVVYTTHMNAGYLRRNGVPGSDRTTMTEYFVRNANILTVLAVIEDPAYLTEPFVVSRNWRLNPTMQLSPYPNPCTPVDEVTGLGTGGRVPHYLPGENPFAGEVTATYGIPANAVRGGAETMYPEFRRQILGAYKRPASCGRYCCGWGGGGTNLAGDAPNLACTTRGANER